MIGTVYLNTMLQSNEKGSLTAFYKLDVTFENNCVLMATGTWEVKKCFINNWQGQWNTLRESVLSFIPNLWKVKWNHFLRKREQVGERKTWWVPIRVLEKSNLREDGGGQWTLTENDSV